MRSSADRWNLVDRWLALWEFGMIQSPPINVYPVAHGLFRPAAINPGTTGDEPLAALSWIFRALWPRAHGRGRP